MTARVSCSDAVAALEAAHVPLAARRGRLLVRPEAGPLAAGELYVGDNGRVMCATVRCAGSTALASGRDLSGQRVTHVTPADLVEWAGYDLGPLTCTCGAVSKAGA